MVSDLKDASTGVVCSFVSQKNNAVFAIILTNPME
jgi:hypothetical protein